MNKLQNLKKQLLRLAVCICCFSYLFDLHAQQTNSQEAPNILLFLIDDIRNTSLGCYGHPIVRTPIIDGIANKGTRFTNAFVTTSICAASRASILTGLYESHHQYTCLLYTSPSPRDATLSRMPSSA